MKKMTGCALTGRALLGSALAFGLFGAVVAQAQQASTMTFFVTSVGKGDGANLGSVSV